jgi:hypothetical protein
VAPGSIGVVGMAGEVDGGLEGCPIDDGKRAVGHGVALFGELAALLGGEEALEEWGVVRACAGRPYACRRRGLVRLG